MPDETLTRRRLAIADLKPITRIPEPVQRMTQPRPPPRPVQPPPRPANKPVTKPAPSRPPRPGLPRPTADYVPPKTPAQIVMEDGFPGGWTFEQSSWRFHRSLWAVHGLTLAFGEYSGIRRQCRPGHGERLSHDVWRVTLRDQRIVVGAHGRMLVVVLREEGWPVWVESGGRAALRRKARKVTA